MNIKEIDYLHTIKYKSNFKIAIIGDLQIIDDKEFEESFLLIDKSINKLKPDLIVLIGDNVWGVYNRDLVIKTYNKINSYGILWCPIFGNHDTDTSVSKKEYSSIFSRLSNCLYKEGMIDEEEGSYGNYVINIEHNNKPMYSLIFLDSGHDHIPSSIVKWYQDVINDSTSKSFASHSIMFFHIPFPEFREITEYAKNNKFDGFSIIKEELCTSHINTNMYDKVCELGNTKAIFCGHDHNNNCDILYNGIRFNYVLKSSKGCYYDEDLQGITTITIKESKELDIKQNHF